MRATCQHHSPGSESSPPDHPAGPVAALHPTDVLVGHQVGGRAGVVHGGLVLAGTPSLEGEVRTDELQ